LKAGETNELTEIDGEIIRQIGDRFQKITRPAAPKRRQRKRHENETAPEPVKEFQDNPEMNPEDQSGKSVEQFDAKETPLKPVLCLQDDGDNTLLSEAEDFGDKEVSVCTDVMTKEEFAIHDGIEQEIGTFPEVASFAGVQTHPEYTAVNEEKQDEVDIGGRRFQLDISSSLIEQARASDQDERNKLAGTIAAQALKKNSELTKVAASADPVPIWNEIKKFVLCKISR
jgi:hypothetical protein